MASNTANEQEPIIAQDDERDELEELDRFLENEPLSHPALIDVDGNLHPLPLSAIRALRQAVQTLAEGEAIAVAPIPRELTTQQAADLLNISRPHLIKLLEQGEIPFHKTGTHRRIRFGELNEYRMQQERARRRELARLTQLSEELGLYGRQ